MNAVLLENDCKFLSQIPDARGRESEAPCACVLCVRGKLLTAQREARNCRTSGEAGREMSVKLLKRVIIGLFRVERQSMLVASPKCSLIMYNIIHVASISYNAPPLDVPPPISVCAVRVLFSPPDFDSQGNLVARHVHLRRISPVLFAMDTVTLR